MHKKLVGIFVTTLLLTIAIPLSASNSTINDEPITGDPPVPPDYRGFICIRGEYYTANRTAFFNISFQEGDTISVFGFVYVFYDETYAFISDRGAVGGNSGFYASSFIGLCRSGRVFGIMLGNITEYIL